ncbi:hypothetical protein MUG91_G77n176 [Manis pentadactyla]|nr:hypothetical protein MUG91_G77n176 [Manis pentadactyla]
MQQVMVSDENPGSPSQLLWTPDTKLLQERDQQTQYPTFAKDGSQGNLPGANITLMSQAQPILIFHLERGTEPCVQDLQDREFLSYSYPADKTWPENEKAISVQEIFENREVC